MVLSERESLSVERPENQSRSSPNRFGISPILVWCLLALAVGAKALASPERHSVWPLIAAASGHWWADESLYQRYPGIDMFRYSPAFAVAMTPLAAMPMPLGGLLWGMGSLALLFVGLGAYHRDVLSLVPGCPDRSAFLILSAVGVAPMAWNLQSNTLLLALLAYGTAAVARGEWWQAAFCLAAAVFIKLWPLAWIAVLVVRHSRQLGFPVAVVLTALTAIPFLAAPPDVVERAYREWWQALYASQTTRWPGYRDLITVWQLTGLPIRTAFYHLLQAAAGGGVLLISILASHRGKDLRRGLAVGFEVWLCWQLLLGPGSEQNTYGLILPFMGWETLRTRREGRVWLWPAAAFVGVLLFSSGDVERFVGRFLPGSTAILPLTVLAYAIWYVTDCFRPVPVRTESRAVLSMR